MFTQEEYIWAWVFYLLGAGSFMAFWWYITGKIKWQEPRYLLRILLGVFLTVPWYTQDNGSYLSPAWLIAAIEGAFEGPEAFWRAGTPLLVVVLFALIVSSGIYLFLWFRSPRQEN